jgi:glycosyltransferase involved in cell wall biosynthesis
LAVADLVVFPSEHARTDALADDLVPAERAIVVPNGIDHEPKMQAVRPSGAESLDGADFLLCLGANYHHKNRLFAIRVLEALQKEHGWGGHLALAGPSVKLGGSADDEAALLALNPHLGRRVQDLGAVTEGEKRWLFERAVLVIYPTVYEGFGLIPFEAAAHDVPCLWAANSSLLGLLGPEAPIAMWNPARTAERAIELITNRESARENIARVKSAGRALTWENAGMQLLDAYKRTCNMPRSSAGVIAGLGPERALTEDGLRLIGPDRALPVELERPLLALSTHRAVGTPILGALGAGYRIAHAARRLWRRAA